MSFLVTEEYLDKAVDTLARSFVHYPYPGGAVSGDERQEKVLSIMYALELKRVSSFGEIVCDSSECKGTAVWCRMGNLNEGADVLKQIRALFSCMTIPEMIKTIRRCMSIERERARLHLSDDTVYLYILGVAPECQGKGIGSALVREKLAECDREGCRVYLETNTEHNVGYYGSFGFSLVKKIVEEHGAFTTWYMIREPVKE
ncbi:MAG TPA: GNAT family N-acetyltransferase [Methanocorpusculum sp.]|nr:GNAT family N-acetyltransferase [Methanocorpusculum sp.]